MNISMLQLLDKINEEVQQAIQDASNEEERRVRDRLAAVKALCELAMNQQGQQASVSPATFVEKRQVVLPVQSSSPLTKSTVIAEGANGDSLFDF